MKLLNLKTSITSTGGNDKLIASFNGLASMFWKPIN